MLAGTLQIKNSTMTFNRFGAGYVVTIEEGDEITTSWLNTAAFLRMLRRI